MIKLNGLCRIRRCGSRRPQPNTMVEAKVIGRVVRPSGRLFLWSTIRIQDTCCGGCLIVLSTFGSSRYHKLSIRFPGL